MEDKCICCGAVIPEGSFTCKNCSVASAPKWMTENIEKVKTKEKKESKKLKKEKRPTIQVVLDEDAKMPTRAHSADAGYDLYSREDAVIYPNAGGIFDTGVHVAIPRGFVGFLKSKSGLNVKHSIQSEGVIDSGYVGSIHVKLFNHGSKAVRIEKGQKISQLVLLPIITPEMELVEELEETERGSNGFGSTGKF